MNKPGLKNLREVIPSPKDYHALPEADAVLIGAIILRGQTIPVQSLRAQFGLGDQREGEVIVIVKSEGRLVAVLVDRVVELVHGGQTRHQAVQRETLDLVGDRRVTADDRLITLLNVERLFDVRGVAIDDGDERAVPEGVSGRVPYLRFTADGMNFMAPLSEVSATIPYAEVEPGAVSGGLCIGMIRRHGVEMAILDTCAAFGFDSGMAHARGASGISLEFGDGDALAFKVDAVNDIVRMDPANIAPIPPVVTTAPHLMSGVLLGDDGRQHFAIDIDACRQDRAFSQLASVAHRIVSSASDTDGLNATKQGGKSIFLIVEAGARAAIPIEDVVEVIRLPPGLRKASANGYMTKMTHRKRLMPVFDLSICLGQKVIDLTGDSSIIVVESDEHFCGWAVSRLQSIDTGVRRVDEFTSTDGRSLMEEAYAQLGDPTNGELTSVVDLRNLLKQFTRPWQSRAT